jgi:hypothetical protein
VNGTSYVNPRFARNENAQLVATFNKNIDAREVAARTQAPCRETERTMRSNSAPFMR